MKPFLFIFSLALCVQPTLGLAHGHQGGHMNLPQMPESNGAIQLPHHGHDLDSSDCRWSELNATERAQMWSGMSARHRDYHWRLLSKEERKALRSQLTSAQRKELRQRFVSGHHHKNSQQTVVLYKRLSKEELQLLREQILQAQRQQVISGLTKTPATEEEQNKLISSLNQINEENHRMIILTIKSGERTNGVGTQPELKDQPKTDNESDPSKVVPIDLAPKTPAAELNP